jgi:hypothetical protein
MYITAKIYTFVKLHNNQERTFFALQHKTIFTHKTNQNYNIRKVNC